MEKQTAINTVVKELESIQLPAIFDDINDKNEITQAYEVLNNKTFYPDMPNVSSKESAQAWIDWLVEKDLIFHMDDNIKEIFTEMDHISLKMMKDNQEWLQLILGANLWKLYPKTCMQCGKSDGSLETYLDHPHCVPCIKKIKESDPEEKEESSEFDALCKELDLFCQLYKLPHESADELLCHDLSDHQEQWVKDFIERWHLMEDKSNAERRFDKVIIEATIDDAIMWLKRMGCTNHGSDINWMDALHKFEIEDSDEYPSIHAEVDKLELRYRELILNEIEV